MSEPVPGAARFVSSRRSIRRLRISAGLTRWVVYAAAVAGILATVRQTVAPPRPIIERAAPSPRIDLAAAGYARLFALRYLAWDSSRPDAYAQALAPFLSDAGESDAGLRLPITGYQTVSWADVVQSREVSRAEHVFTVAAQTSGDGLVYLSVDVIHDPGNGLTIGRYPAFVGPPLAHPVSLTADSSGEADVGDAAVARVVERALRNYLAGSLSNLAADLTTGARVAPPTNALSLERVVQLQWRADHTGVYAIAAAHDARGVGYTLSYELDVASQGGRWEVGAIQTDPGS